MDHWKICPKNKQTRFYICDIVSSSPLREILAWALPFFLQPLSLIGSVLCSSIGDLCKLSEMGMQISKEWQKKSIVNPPKLVERHWDINRRTYSCCSGFQGSTCCLCGSASFSCGRWGSGTGRVGDCGSKFPPCTLYHCCMDTPENENDRSGPVLLQQTLFSTLISFSI